MGNLFIKGQQENGFTVTVGCCQDECTNVTLTELKLFKDNEFANIFLNENNLNKLIKELQKCQKEIKDIKRKKVVIDYDELLESGFYNYEMSYEDLMKKLSYRYPEEYCVMLYIDSEAEIYRFDKKEDALDFKEKWAENTEEECEYYGLYVIKNGTVIDYIEEGF